MNGERPTPMKPQHEPTLWLDFATGNGVDDEGRAIEVVLGGRRTKNPLLVDLLETARRHHATRIMLCGDVPGDPAWLLPDKATIARGGDWTPGWTDEGHYLESPPQGRFRHTETGHFLRIQTAQEWFPVTPGPDPLEPAHAWYCHRLLTQIVNAAIKRDWPLLRSPGATLLNIWKLRAPDSYAMEPIDPDIGREIQANEPQHRVELYTSQARCSCEDCLPLVTTPEIPGFYYGDGRFMFHGAPPKPLGAAPAVRVNAADASALFENDPYWPARYLVQATVPDFWETLGILPLKHEETDRGWHWPNRPGATFTTWADAAEVRTAREWLWQIKILEGVKFARTDSLRATVDVVQTMLDGIAGLTLAGKPASASMKRVLTGAVQHMYRVAIGSFSRRQALTTRFAPTMGHVPAEAVGRVDPMHGGFVYRIPTPQSRRFADTWHPEIAARVWGTSRVAVLSTPTSKNGPTRGQKYGALEVQPEQLLGITGDAIYTTTLQRWMLPIDQPGGGDDGKNGRLRLKGYLPGPLATPANAGERQLLSNQAEEHGLEDLR